MLKTPWNFCSFSNKVPGGWGKTEKGGRPNPGERGVAGGEARGGGAKGVQAAPLGTLVREEVAGGGGSAEDGGLAVVCNGGDGAPVADGRREAAKKIREGEAELAVGLARAERRWRRGSTVDSEAAAEALVGGVFRWGLGEEEGWVSCARSRRN